MFELKAKGDNFETRNSIGSLDDNQSDCLDCRNLLKFGRSKLQAGLGCILEIDFLFQLQHEVVFQLLAYLKLLCYFVFLNYM